MPNEQPTAIDELQGATVEIAYRPDDFGNNCAVLIFKSKAGDEIGRLLYDARDGSFKPLKPE